MTAPAIVHSADDMRADQQEVVLMLDDFSFHTPDELLARLTKSSGSQSATSKSSMVMKGHSGSMGSMNMGSGTAMDLNDILEVAPMALLLGRPCSLAAVCYDSESAFARAFQRRFGIYAGSAEAQSMPPNTSARHFASAAGDGGSEPCWRSAGARGGHWRFMRASRPNRGACTGRHTVGSKRLTRI
jgi:hypothetical protein